MAPGRQAPTPSARTASQKRVTDSPPSSSGTSYCHSPSSSTLGRSAAGGFSTIADFAIVGLSTCEYNALGYHFFRKSGIVLGLDFTAPGAVFRASVPFGGVTLPFEASPPYLASFKGAFVEVEVSAGSDTRSVLGLLDSGAAATAMRRSLAGTGPLLTPDRLNIRIAHEQLGTVAVTATLFDTQGLPDLILGLDVMDAWGERWYFSFIPGAGTVTVFLRDDSSQHAKQTEPPR